MKRILVLLVLQLSILSLMQAQGEFVTRGTSAWSGDLLMQLNSEASEFGIQAGYSYKGFLDAGLLYLKGNARDYKNGILSPSITYYIVKQEDGLRAPTVGVSIGYRHYTSTKTSTAVEPDSLPALSYHTDTMTTAQTVNAVVIDLGAHKRIGYWNVFFFQPTIGGSLSITNTEWIATLRGGIEIGTRVVRGPLIVLTPGLEYQSQLTSFTLSLRAVF